MRRNEIFPGCAVAVVCTFLSGLTPDAMASEANLTQGQKDSALTSENQVVLDQMGVDIFIEAMMIHMYPRNNSKVMNLHPDLTDLANGFSTLGGFMRTQGAPSYEIDENPYVAMTYAASDEARSTEYLLAKQIMASKGGLKPADVFRMAVEITDGDVALAMLTAHNLLKEVKYKSIPDNFNKAPLMIADVEQRIDSQTRKSKWEKVSTPEFMEKLVNLRPQGESLAFDKIGPWYHTFGLLFVGDCMTPTAASIGSKVENFWRYLGVGSAWDPAKMAVNSWANDLTYPLCLLQDWQSGAYVAHRKGWFVPRALDLCTDAELGALLDELNAEDRFLVKRGDVGVLRKAVAFHIARVEKEVARRKSPALYCTRVSDAAGNLRSRPNMSVVLYPARKKIYMNELSVPRLSGQPGTVRVPDRTIPVLPPNSDGPSADKRPATKTVDKDPGTDLYLRQITLSFDRDGRISGSFRGVDVGAGFNANISFTGWVHGQSVEVDITYPEDPSMVGAFGGGPIPAGRATMLFDSPTPPKPEPAKSPLIDKVNIFYPPGMN